LIFVLEVFEGVVSWTKNFVTQVMIHDLLAASNLLWSFVEKSSFYAILAVSWKKYVCHYYKMLFIQ